MIYGFIAIAVIVGMFMPMQAGINSELSRIIKNPFLGAFISLSIGALALGFILILKGFPSDELKRLTTIPPHLLLGGILGAVFVGSTIFFIPRIGATPMVAAFVTGQLLMSILIDHFGLFGVPVYSVNTFRIIGVFLLFLGITLVIKKSA